MKMQIVAIRDAKADCFGAPMFQTNLGGAIRQFNDECKRADDNNLLFKHPEDFELFKLGTYDDEHATFELLERPLSIALGSEAKTKPEGRVGMPVNVDRSGSSNGVIGGQWHPEA